MPSLPVEHIRIRRRKLAALEYTDRSISAAGAEESASDLVWGETRMRSDRLDDAPERTETQTGVTRHCYVVLTAFGGSQANVTPGLPCLPVSEVRERLAEIVPKRRAVVSYGEKLFANRMQTNHLRSTRFVEMTSHGVPYRLMQLLQRIGLRKNRLPQRARQPATFRGLLYDEYDLVHTVIVTLTRTSGEPVRTRDHTWSSDRPPPDGQPIVRLRWISPSLGKARSLPGRSSSGPGEDSFFPKRWEEVVVFFSARVKRFRPTEDNSGVLLRIYAEKRKDTRMNLNDGLLLAAISGALLGAPACASDKTPADDPSAMAGSDDMASPGKHACKGQNECKGQGGCKTA